jgi:hypothetical protein
MTHAAMVRAGVHRKEIAALQQKIDAMFDRLARIKSLAMDIEEVFLLGHHVHEDEEIRVDSFMKIDHQARKIRVICHSGLTARTEESIAAEDDPSPLARTAVEEELHREEIAEAAQKLLQEASAGESS